MDPAGSNAAREGGGDDGQAQAQAESQAAQAQAAQARAAQAQRRSRSRSRAARAVAGPAAEAEGGAGVRPFSGEVVYLQMEARSCRTLLVSSSASCLVFSMVAPPLRNHGDQR